VQFRWSALSGQAVLVLTEVDRGSAEADARLRNHRFRRLGEGKQRKMPAEVPLTDDDRRVLEVAVQYWDAHMTFPSNRWISAGTGIPPIGVGEAMQRLSEADPPYLNKRQGVTERGRLALMQGHNRAHVGSRPIRLFYSYSHKDENLRERLEVHLSILNNQGLIEPWHDRKITAGRVWKNDIDDNLEAADVILLLVSSDFLASNYAYNIEFKRALERHRLGEVRVVPIILRYSDWQETPIGELQALPTDGKPVAGRGDRAWMDVTNGLRQVITEIRQAD